MATTASPEAHAGLWARLERHRTPHTLSYRIIHYGFWSSCIFLVLMLFETLTPNVFSGIYMWVALVYLGLQWAEVISRNPLKPGEVSLGVFLSFCPAVFSLIIEVLDWTMDILTPLSRHVMNLWFLSAWIAFAMGIWSAYAILQTPYRRDESRAPRT